MGHHVQPSLRPGWTATIPDVVESGPISVILVPLSTASHYTDPQIQLPLVPEMASFARRPLGNSEGVEFE